MSQTPLTPALAATADVDIDRMMRDLHAISPYVKLPGTKAERESLGYLAHQLQAAGFRTEILDHDAYISLPGAAELRLQPSAEALTCITHSFSRPTPPEGIEAECIYIGTATREALAAHDLRGKFVILNGLAASNPTLLCSEAGALGQIHVMPHEYRHEMCVSNIWGSPDHAQMAELPKTVIVTVNHADGQRLIAAVNAGSARVYVKAEVETGWRKTPILTAEMMPMGEPEAPFVLFSGHHDTWYEGVMDNGAANITMIEVARAVGARRALMKRGLRLCIWSGHSQGRYSGSAWYADQFWHELDQRCQLHVNIDSTGGIGNVVLSEMCVSAELAAFGNRHVEAVSGQSLAGRRMSRAGDQSFWGIGIPAMFMTTGEQPVGSGANVAAGFLGASGPPRKGAGFGYWWHTEHDLIDKIDPELLARDTKVYVATIIDLLDQPLLPLDYAAWADSLLGHLEGLGDHDPEFRTEMAELGRLAQALRAAASGADLAARDPKAACRLLCDVARVLVPIDYTSGNRYQPDPALIASPYPVLEPLRHLQEAARAGSELQAHRVAARRAFNCTADALRRACAIYSSPAKA